MLQQFQSPTLGFLIGGMLLAALKSELKIPSSIYKFVVFMLMMKIGLKGGIEIRSADFSAIFLPAISAGITGLVIVGLGALFFSRVGVPREDGIATAGLFGAVSASTLAAAMVVLEEENIHYEAWLPALYPFMDIPALILAIVMARLSEHRKADRSQMVGVIKESLRGSALSALLLGLFLGLVTQPVSLLEGFYEPLFRGFLSILLLIMGMEAVERLRELRSVAHWYLGYALIMPVVHGLIAFGFGYIAHHLVGFSVGGVILLAVMAASSSDISGPPTLRAGIPKANPSAYLGASTSVGTPVAISVCIPFFVALSQVVFV